MSHEHAAGDIHPPSASPGEHATHENSAPVLDVRHVEHQSSPYPHCPVNHTRIIPPKTRTNPVRRFLIGDPLRSEEMPQQRIGETVGIGAFGADAFSSVAYATQEILHVLILAGAAALSLSLPIAGAICGLLIIITLSYRQIIFAYPDGGGAYTVARDNLGLHTAQIAGAALLTDYVLTVAVSISSGVEQVASAFPSLLPHRVTICVIAILILTLINLRGVQTSIKWFALPTYAFLAMILLMLGMGIWRGMQGTLPRAETADTVITMAQPLTVLLVLRAFSAGSTALTGMKAISTRVTTFHEPRSRLAVGTLLAISSLLTLIFLGITLLASYTHTLPLGHETVFSQLAHTVFDEYPALYYAMIATTTIILIMAANTSFARFPRLAALQAQDGFLPHQFRLRGHRLVFWWGTMVLALCAVALVLFFQASTTALIPLYAIGVFLSFTMAQAAMVMRWRHISRLKPGEEVKRGRSVLRHTPHWRVGLWINAIGCLATALVTLVFAVTRFLHGAWIVFAVMVVMLWVFFLIKRHYQNVAQSLSLEHYEPEPEIDPRRHTVVILVSGVHQGTLVATRYARSIHADKRVAIHVETDPEQTLKVHERWRQWVPDIPLMVVDSPYRTLFKPLVHYVNTLVRKGDTDLVTIVIPQFVCVRWWHHFLHNQTALMVRSAFLFHRDKVVIEVPFRLNE